MSTTVSTTTVGHACGKPHSPRVFSAAGRLWAIYFDSDKYRYRSSADSGASWSAATDIADGSVGYALAANFDGTYIHIVHGINSDLTYLRGTPASNGVITFTSAATLGLSGAWIDSLAFDADGKVVISYTSGSHVYVGKNNNTNGTWSNASGYPKQISSATASDHFSQVVTFGSGWYCGFGAGGTKLRGRYWNGTALAAAEDISSQNLVYGLRFTLTALGSVLEAVWNTDNAGVRSRRNGGSSWGTELTVASTVNVVAVPLAVATSTKTFCFYIHSGALYYRTSTAGGAWSAATSLSADNFPAPDLLASSNGAAGGKVHLLTARGTSAYSVAYDAVSADVAPDAVFTAVPTSGYAPLTVQFTDASTGAPTGRDWNFGDGSAHSSASNPVHAYAAVGTYSAVLWVSNSVGSDSATRSITATAPPAPAASFSFAPLSGSTPLLVAFTDLTTNNPVSWSWAFGDGGSSTTRNPQYTFNSPGTFSVVLSASNLAGFSKYTASIPVTRGSAPTGYMYAYPTAGYAPMSVWFYAFGSGGQSWSWNFGDGTSASGIEAIHTYASGGVYTATLQAMNVNGTLSGTQTISVSSEPDPMAPKPVTSASATIGPRTAYAARCLFTDTFRRPVGNPDPRNLLWSGSTEAYWSCSDVLYKKGTLSDAFLATPTLGTYDRTTKVWIRHDAATSLGKYASVCFRYKDPNNWATVNWWGQYGTMQIETRQGGTNSSMASKNISTIPSLSAWNHLSIEDYGGLVKFYLNDQYLFTQDVGRFASQSTAVALRANHCHAQFRDFHVYDTGSQGDGWQPFALDSVQPSINIRKSLVPVPTAARPVLQTGVGYDRQVTIEGTLFADQRPDLPLNSIDTASAETFFQEAMVNMRPLYIHTPVYTATCRVVGCRPIARRTARSLPRFSLDLSESVYFDWEA
jgi:PKD repeat protein